MASCQIQNKMHTTNPRTHLDEKMSQSPIGKALKRKHNKELKIHSFRPYRCCNKNPK